MSNDSSKKKGFAPGQSGNPKGRPKGARNKATILAEELLHGEAEAITRKVIELAKTGNHVALKLCLERLLPPLKERALDFAMPEKANIPEIVGAYERLFSRLADGDLSLSEAAAISRLFQSKLEVVEMERMAADLADLKQELSK